MIQFRVYLHAELGKLRNRGDAANFIRAVPDNVLAKLSLCNEPDGLSNQFLNQDAVSLFVDQLVDEDVRVLVKFCDRNWRKNGVFTKLQEGKRWEIHDVYSGDIDIQQAEPRLCQLFRDHHYNLIAIATDTMLLQEEPYVNRTAAEPVYYPILLAVRQNGRHRIFDGIHRAIQLVRNGQDYLQLCVPV